MHGYVDPYNIAAEYISLGISVLASSMIFSISLTTLSLSQN